MLKWLKNTGFTLVEIIITIVLIGVIATFAMPNYYKAIAKAHERDAIIQLLALHAACQNYKALTGTYYVGALGPASAINAALNTNIISKDLSYGYESSDGSTFNATTNLYNGAAIVWKIKITNSPIDSTGIPPNPCCVTGSPCPSLPNC